MKRLILALVLVTGSSAFARDMAINFVHLNSVDCSVALTPTYPGNSQYAAYQSSQAVGSISAQFGNGNSSGGELKAVISSVVRPNYISVNGGKESPVLLSFCSRLKSLAGKHVQLFTITRRTAAAPNDASKHETLLVGFQSGGIATVLDQEATIRATDGSTGPTFEDFSTFNLQ